jgi:serine/threonine-protein kinase RIO1
MFVNTVRSKFSQGQRSSWIRKRIADRDSSGKHSPIQIWGMQNFRNMSRPAESG